MNRASKAALFSAFVFPGSGQIYLKRRLHGLTMMSVTLLALVIVVARAVISAMEVLRTMQMEGKVSDVNAVSNIAVTSSADASTGFWAALLVLTWIVSIVDAYVIGKKEVSQK